MNDDLFNNNFRLPSHDYSKMYSLEDLKELLSDDAVCVRIKNSFRRRNYISNKDFKFITWNTFSEMTHDDNQRKRKQEDADAARERMDYLEKYIEDCIRREVRLAIIEYKNNIYIYNTVKYPNPDRFINELG